MKETRIKKQYDEELQEVMDLFEEQKQILNDIEDILKTNSEKREKCISKFNNAPIQYER